MSEHVPTRTSERIPEHVQAFMLDGHIPDVMPEQVSEHCVNARVRQRVRIVCEYMCLVFFQLASQGGDHSRYQHL